MKNIPWPIKLVIAQLPNHVNIRLISRLMKGISKVLQKLLSYFSGTAISTFFVLPATEMLAVIIALNVNDSESAIGSLATSLWYCHKYLDVFT